MDPKKKYLGKRLMLTIVGINGSPTRQSKTGILIDAVADAVATALPTDSYKIALSDVGHEVMCGLTRPDVSVKGEELLQLVERADLLIIGTPVYRAAYTGLLKHFFDLVDRDAMRNRKAILCATGGTPMHALVIEHQMRPLMGFFAIQTVTTGLYGLSDDFASGAVSSPALRERIERAADEAVGLLVPSRVPVRQLVE
ncbi:NAD(P)H-dependent oxidoreductase [Hyphomicrobium facile]|uniref:FMN reductase n=1 Tax=Hyphomicrobium facile TaxID=51670 RepID=A0A1I7NPV8_9HYPH|nr:NAD(P)H-dependent oxidoreductase [Hyphomicrobium facile]SFV36714.1 FMN reductase [Hyphomicrobium facile]